MKKFLYLSTFFLTLFTALQVHANVITIKGHVKLTNGSPAVNAQVQIAVYVASSTTSCSEQVVLTNSQGFYSKELSCSGDIRRSRISVKNCNGQLLVQEPEVPASKIIEANFTLCVAEPPKCSASFKADPVPATAANAAFSVKFNSSESTAGNGDNIIHRTWYFGDGTPTVTDRVDPTHTFPHDGTYEVCLVIKTALGCESKVCKQVVIPPVKNVACIAKFNAEQVPASSTVATYTVKFNSSESAAGNGDNIIHRAWYFGDGTPVVTDRVDPTHTFLHDGTYEVCLVIKTALGCENKVCKQIVIPPVKNVACVAKFTAEPVPVSSTVAASTVKFNSSESVAGNGDNIIHRTWYFGDGSPAVTDRVDPTHTFPHDGAYEVCLVIKTASGCENKVCKKIVVPPVNTTACTARFTFEKLGPLKFRFNSNVSVVSPNDYIVERKWDFKDGSTSNDVSPLHEFAKPGNYEVCLKIKTSKGCENMVCVAVKVDEVSGTGAGDAMIKIVSLYPLPVKENLHAVIYSKNNNVIATISIVNIYGTIQSTRQITLTAGFNSIPIPVYALLKGPYFIRVMTQYGTISKTFYKL